MHMEMDAMKSEDAQSSLGSALPKPLDSHYHELWTCGGCGREFGDCTSCVAHEQQCGGHLNRW
ncbi:MAG: hypothetical protein QOJ57_3077 [Thermoleophilaceae bacterium]|jgi:hypothetical protein|nr:hypothetical protein [Thermoleophilaceae bacterium]